MSRTVSKMSGGLQGQSCLVTELPSTLPPSTTEQEHEVAENQNTRMRKQWEKALGKELGTPDRYQKTAVLIISWAEHLDLDLKCGLEVKELDELFRTEFHYESTVLRLDNRVRQPQVQLNHAINEFIVTHDGHHRSTLLIVYYTGHGATRKMAEGDVLLVSGKQHPGLSSGEGGVHPVSARWDLAEKILDFAEADVLTIMDCCSAGSVMESSTYKEARSFETLAATGRKLLTPGPGGSSYSRALIDSLKEELEKYRSQEQRPFNTFDLTQSIKRRQDWNHMPQHFNRACFSKFASRHILLAPLEKKVQKSETPTGQQEQAAKSAGRLMLEISFRDKNDLTDEEVTKLATRLAKCAKESELGITALDWIGFTPEPTHLTKEVYEKKVVWLLVGAFARWKWRAQRNSRRGVKRHGEESTGELDPAKRPRWSSPEQSSLVVTTATMTPPEEL